MGRLQPSDTIRRLSEPGAVNFRSIFDELPNPVPDAFAARIRPLMAVKIYETLVSGHFGDLEGADLLLERLQMRLAFPGDVANAINLSLAHLSMSDLISIGLTQPAIMSEQDLQAARHVLAGTALFDLDDAVLSLVVAMRHVTMHLLDRGQHQVVAANEGFVLLTSRNATLQSSESPRAIGL